MSPEIKKYQSKIAKRVRDLRRKRRWTQKDLAILLGLSQNRLSELERGKGSFSAEQLFLIAKTFNISFSDFLPEEKRQDALIQDALARLGAPHLKETGDIVPSAELEKLETIVPEILVASKSPRHLCALGPVLVRHADPPAFNQIRYKLKEAGYINRYGWLLENIRWAINKELEREIPWEWKQIYKKADFVLKNLLAFPWFSLHEEARAEDILDADILSEKTAAQVRETSSVLSKKWKVVTRLQPEDFAKALKDARETG